MAKFRMSPIQEMNLMNVATGDIPLSATSYSGSYLDMYTHDIMGTLFRNQSIRKAAAAAKGPGVKGFRGESLDVSGGKGVIDELRQRKLDRHQLIINSFYNSIHEGMWEGARALALEFHDEIPGLLEIYRTEYEKANVENIKFIINTFYNNIREGLWDGAKIIAERFKYEVPGLREAYKLEQEKAEKKAVQEKVSQEQDNKTNVSTKINREAILATMYFDALRENRLSDAQSLSALDTRLRKHWNSRVQDIQQTKIVRQMLGDKATPDVFMSNTERVAFYNDFIKNKSLSKSEREYNNYLLYMYYYGCAVHAVLNALLHARGMSLTDAQYEEFLRALYERRNEVFTSDDFDNSYRLIKDISGNVTGIDNKAKNIILKNNLKGANIIKEILQKNLNIDMSDVFIVDETTRTKKDNDVLIEGSYAVTAEDSGNTAHKFVQDTVTKALFDSLKGRNTKHADKQERLWIGTTTGISGSAY